MTYDDGIAYTCGKFVHVEIPLTDEYLLQFQMGTKNLADEYQLEWWLDNVIEQTKGFKDVEAAKRKSSGRSKKHLS